jgi:hypothetical protein
MGQGQGFRGLGGGSIITPSKTQIIIQVDQATGRASIEVTPANTLTYGQTVGLLGQFVQQMSQHIVQFEIETAKLHSGIAQTQNKNGGAA